jgi:elongation factor G
MSELHLEIICDRIAREFEVPLHVEKPGVVHLETIRKQAVAEGKYIRQVGGRGQYAHVKMELEPGEQESGYQFADRSPEGAILRQFVKSIDAGIQKAMKAGVLGGNELVDVRAILRDGSYHVEDSNELSFEIAAATAFKEAARKASPTVVEPLMSVRVFASEDFAGAIVGDLTSRRGQIEGVETSANGIVISAIAPLGELLGYRKHLRSLTQGRGSSSMQFARYQSIPDDRDSGADEVGVSANKPKGPTRGQGTASAKSDERFG